jgi:hypothetical protein
VKNFIAAITWANLPTPQEFGAGYVHIPDIGAGGSLWYSDGALWRPVNGSVLLASGANSNGFSHTGNTDETDILTWKIPGGLMGPNGALELIAAGLHSNSANDKTYRVKTGSSGAVEFLRTNEDGAAAHLHVMAINTGSESSVVLTGRGAVDGSAAGSNNSAVDWTLKLTGQLEDGGEFMEIDNYALWLHRG